MSALKASFLVVNHIAKIKKPSTIGEELILPTVKDICREVLDAAVKSLVEVPLLASTITKRIDEIAEEIKAQLLQSINESQWYTIQVDESTDIDNEAIKLVFVRYIFQEDLNENMLCALLLLITTTAVELFNFLDDYISGKLNWSFCIDVCMDGFAAMTGDLSGFIIRIKQVTTECESTHCVIQR